MKLNVFMYIIISIFLVTAGCTPETPAKPDNDSTVCAQDAKVCPDGTTVARDSDNNCEFEQCPQILESRNYVSTDFEECNTVLYQCIEGSEPFFDRSGCGCKALKPRSYVNTDLSECEGVRFLCEPGMKPFFDDTGCGCEFDWGQDTTDSKEQKTFCTQDQRGNFCTKQYEPTCGWFKEEIVCIKYPCAADFGNACEACSDENVAYWTKGLCPQG